MRVRADPAVLNRDISVPRPVSRHQSYRSSSGQASTSSGSHCASLTCIEDRIEEESEENEMVLGGPSDRREERDQYDSDTEDDDDISHEPVVQEIGPQLPGVFDDGYSHDDTLPTSGIIVTVSPSEDDLPSSSTAGSTSMNSDNQLLIQLRVREYQGNFDGFAEINRFKTIEEMHEFIVNNSEPVANETSGKQNRYLDILLKEKPQDRFRRLLETSKGAVRRVLARNEHILSNLFSSASLENFPSPFVPKDEDDDVEEEEVEEDLDTNENIAEVEENMKRWYLIEVIGIWLKLVADVKSYREAIKKCVLKTRCGIENDRYEGIAVPLKYK